jgi:small subunit ribosomal protein S20
MPNIKAKKKHVLTSKLRHDRNKAGKSELRTFIKKARAEKENITSDKILENAVIKTTIIKLDKAASKGIIHKNKAARLKSRLSRQVSKISNAS